MRSIKFRAWLQGRHENINFGEEGWMDYDISIGSEGYLDIESGWDIQGSYSTVPVMQYTGRKDKNGTEVYEGDIVKIEHWTTLKVMTYIDRKMGFYPVDTKSSKAFEMNVSDAMYEVVGNIYENPELLGVKK